MKEVILNDFVFMKMAEFILDTNLVQFVSCYHQVKLKLN